MPKPALSQPQVEALTVYMLSLRQRDLPAEYLAPDKIDEQYARCIRPPRTGERSTAVLRRLPRIRDLQPLGQEVRALRSGHPRSVAYPHGRRRMPGGEHPQGRPGTRMPGWGPKAGGLEPAEVAAVWLPSDFGARHGSARRTAAR